MFFFGFMFFIDPCVIFHFTTTASTPEEGGYHWGKGEGGGPPGATIYTHACVDTNKDKCLQYLHVYLHTYKGLCTCIRADTVYICIHMYVYIYTHMYICVLQRRPTQNLGSDSVGFDELSSVSVLMIRGTQIPYQMKSTPLSSLQELEGNGIEASQQLGIPVLCSAANCSSDQSFRRLVPHAAVVLLRSG